MSSPTRLTLRLLPFCASSIAMTAFAFFVASQAPETSALAQVKKAPTKVEAQKQKSPVKTPTAAPEKGVTTWPAVPQSTPELLETRRKEYYLPSLKFQKSILETPPAGYNLLKESTSNSAVRGTLLYPTDRGGQYLVMRGFNNSHLLNGVETQSAAYWLQVGGTLFEPEFSQDGKLILFRGGDPFESTGRYYLFLWDTTNSTVRAVSREPDEFDSPSPRTRLGESMVFRNVYWSPNARWIAYVRGGDRGGKVRSGMKFPQLRLLNVNSGRSRRVIRNFGAVQDMAWTSQNTLLFAMNPENAQTKQRAEKEENARDKATDPEPDAPTQTSIFEAAPGKGNKPRLLIANAERPAPSPNNRYVAFMRPKIDPNNPAQELCLFDRQGGAIKTLATKKLSYVQWMPDNRHLVLLTALYYGENDGTTRGEGQISVLDVQSGDMRDVKKLVARDYKFIPGSEQVAQFYALKTSRDGRFAFVTIQEFIAPPPEGSSVRDARITFLAVDLKSGDIIKVAQLDNPGTAIIGLDWHDETGTTVTDITPFTIRAKK